ncbi:MAG: arylsulfotransferase family protein [Actinomycetota bacterium]
MLLVLLGVVSAPAAQAGVGRGTTPVGTAAVPTVSTTPALSPAFAASVTDYVVRCADSNGTVTLTADMPTGTEISVDGGAAQSGLVTVNLPLGPNEKFIWTITSGGASTTYYARCLPADFPQWTATRSGTPQAQWYTAAPGLSLSGVSAAQYTVVFDANGTPVWWMRETQGTPLDVKFLPDTGSGPEIAWVTGVGGYSLNSTYKIRGLDGRLLRSIGGSTLDHHDLQRTVSGSYLAVRYVPRSCPTVPGDCVDESPWGGPTSVNPIDAEVVEFDASGNQISTWSTRNHVALAESASWIAAGITSDVIHINSVEPDGAGGFIFSARHLNAVYHVDSTGIIDWKIGGSSTPASLTVVGDSSGGPVFGGQHDARLLPDGTVTVYDNGTLLNRPPRALRFAIDLTARTATVIENVADSRVPGSACCGSARRLPGGNWVAGWGGTAVAAELTPQGSPVLTVQSAPGLFTYRFVPVEPGVVSASQLRQGMDAMLPQADMASPSDGAVVSNSTWLVADTRGLVASTEFRLAGNGLTDRPIASGTLGVYGWMAGWDSSSVPNGTYSVYVRASSGSGAVADSMPVSVTVDNAASVTIADPVNGAVVSGLRWLAAGTTGFTTKVEFRITGKRLKDRLLGVATATPYGWLFPWDSTTVAKGTYRLVARAYDGSGRSIDSAPVTISVSQSVQPAKGR